MRKILDATGEVIVTESFLSTVPKLLSGFLQFHGFQLGDDLSELGIIIASGYGASQSTFDFLDSMIADDGACPSPTVFANSVHSSAASNLSILLGIRGPCVTVSQFGLSPVSGLLTAREWLRSGRVKAVLFGAVDELCPVLAYSYDCFFPEQCMGPIRPLDLACQTAVPGEGAAFLVLGAEGGDQGHGWLTGVGWETLAPGLVPSGMLCVVGAEGHACCAAPYTRLLNDVDGKVATYSRARGSLPSGQAFDIIAATLDAKLVGFREACSVTCDASGTCGVCTWRASAGT